MFLRFSCCFFLFAYISYSSNVNNVPKFIDGVILNGNSKLTGIDIGINNISDNILKKMNLSIPGIVVSNFTTDNKKLITCNILEGKLEYEGDIYGAGYSFKDGKWEKNQKSSNNIFEGRNFRIIWTSETSGKIIFEPDQYFNETSEFIFDNYEFIHSKTFTEQGIIIDKFIVNRLCSKRQLKDFALEMKNQTIGKKLSFIDIKYLYEKGYLKKDIDYTVDSNNNIKFIGKSYFSLSESISSKTFRITKLNDVSLTTCWETGEKKIEIIEGK